jgi:hypothetical protein
MTWGTTDNEFQAAQYRSSRSHCSRELLEAISGVAPVKWLSISPRNLPIDGPACGFEDYSLKVNVHDVRPEVTCPKCRALMRAVRPQSAPLHEVKLDYARRPCGYVGGEQMSMTDYTLRVRIRSNRQEEEQP